MAIIPKSNLTGLPEVTAEDMKTNDPARLNRIIRLLATQIHGVQTGVPSSTSITNITENISGGGGGSSGGGGGGGGAITGVTIQGTHDDRISIYLPSLESAGTYYYEIDRTVTYLNFLTPSTTPVWQYVSGIMIAAFAGRPSDLGQYDAGFLFYATDRELTYLWDGASWNIFNNFEPVLADTHANRLTNYPSVNYTLNTLFEETDRTVMYWVQNATGTVNTSGTTVTWVSGDHFINSTPGFTAGQWPPGTSIVINGVTYAIGVAGVTSPTSLPLASSAGIQTGVDYLVVSGRWVYLSGQYASELTDLPTDIGENETILAGGRVASGFLFFENDTYFHQLQWNVSAWQRGPSDLEHSDTFHEFGAAPTDGGWAQCDGGTKTYLKYDGTTGTRTVPDLSTAAYAKSTKATYSPTLNTPTLPVVTTTVPGATAGTGSVAAGVGAPVSVLVPPLTPGGGVNIAATVTLPDDPIEYYSAIKYYRL